MIFPASFAAAAEAEARQDYYILLEYWYDDLTNEEIEQIKEIPGIKESVFNQIKDLITV